MNRLKNVSIRAKLLWMILVVAVPLLLVGLSISGIRTYRTLQQDMVYQTETTARILADYSVTDLAFSDRKASTRTLSRITVEPSIEVVALFEDRELFSYFGTEDIEFAPPDDLTPATWFSTNQLHVIIPVEQDGHQYGALYLRASTQGLDDRVIDLATEMGILTLILCLLAALAAVGLQRIISDPILRLTALARRVSEGDYHLRAPHVGENEIGVLYDGFNVMLDEIQRRERERDDAEEEVRGLNEHLERRVAERTAALQAANQELEAFNYSASHDLRAPLRHIAGLSQLVVRRVDDLPEKAQEYLNKIITAASTMERIIDSLLKLSRVTRAGMNREIVDVSAMAQKVVEKLRQENSPRQLEFSIAPSLNAHADANLLLIVLNNLIGNAWKFTQKKAGAVIEFGVTHHQEEEAFFVRDNGAGFDMEFASKLFKPFQRLHSGEEFSGTGIGLATVNRIVTRHGGRIWAHGATDAGATFYFTLSSTSSEIESVPNYPSQSKEPKNEELAVVEPLR